MDAQKKSTLGAYLKSLREARTFSLREVAGRTGVSNAFLSQIESGKVKKPSPLALFKVAELYGVPYEVLMQRAGYPVPSADEAPSQSASAVFNRMGQITEEEEQELLDYLAFLRSRTRKDGRKK